MEVSSGPRWPRRSSTQEVGSQGDGADLISAFPDEVLLLFLARLPCASAAARTSVLSRRWRGLWARLRQIVFRDVALPSLEEALGRVLPPPHAVSLEICVPKEQRTDNAGVNLLLRAAARLEPEKLDFRLPSYLTDLPSACCLVAVDLPCSHRTTSISLGLSTPFFLRVPAGAQFPGLEALSLSHCTTELDALLSCCPRLRTLRVTRDLFPKSATLGSTPRRCRSLLCTTGSERHNMWTSLRPRLSNWPSHLPMVGRSASPSWRQWWRRFRGTAATWDPILCLVFGASRSCGYRQQTDKDSYPRCKFMPVRTRLFYALRWTTLRGR